MKKDNVRKTCESVELTALEKLLISVVLFAYLLLVSSRVMGASFAFSIQNGVAEDSIEYSTALSALTKNPNDVEILLNLSKLETRLGGRLKPGHEKSKLLANAKVHALQAIRQSPNNVEAHFNFIIAIGLLSEDARSPKEKLRYARTIKAEADLILRLDSSHAGACFVLAKWNEALSSLNAAERLFWKLFFADVPPGASMDQALFYYRRAIALRPDFILFHYGLAHALASAGDRKAAARTLRHAMSLPVLEPDDVIRKDNCAALLEKLNPLPL